MKGDFNYGLLFTLGGVTTIVIIGEVVLWFSRRANRRAGDNSAEVADRLERAEAALREANEEIANIRETLTVGR